MRVSFSFGILPAAALATGWLAGRQYWPHTLTEDPQESAAAASQAGAAGGNSASNPASQPPRPAVSKADIASAVKTAREANSETALRDSARRMALEQPPALTEFLEAATDSETVRAALREDAVYWAFCRNAAAGLAQLSAVADPKAAAAIAKKALHFFPPKDLPTVLKWYQTLPGGELRLASLTEINPVLARRDFALAVALTAALPGGTGTAAASSISSQAADSSSPANPGKGKRDESPPFSGNPAGVGVVVGNSVAPETTRASSRRRELMSSLLTSVQGRPEEIQARLELFPAEDRDFLKSRLQSRDFQVLYNSDREAAVPALANFPASESREKAVDFFQNWAQNDPIRAVQAIGQVPESARSPLLYSAFAREWAAGNVGSASAWVDSLPPGPDREAAAQGLVKGLTKYYPAEALTWAAATGHETGRLQLLKSVMDGTPMEKRAQLLPVVNSLKLSDTEKTILRNTLPPEP